MNLNPALSLSLQGRSARSSKRTLQQALNVIAEPLSTDGTSESYDNALAVAALQAHPSYQIDPR